MLPILTFATGVVAGILGVQLVKKAKGSASLSGLGQKTRGGLDRAGAGLRDATLTGLSALEKSSAGLRERLAPAPDTAAPDTAAPESPLAAQAEAPPVVAEAAVPAEPPVGADQPSPVGGTVPPQGGAA